MNPIDELTRSIRADTPAADRVEHDALKAVRRSLRAAIAAEQSGRGARNPRRRLIALFAVLAIAAITVPAFGVANGWFAGGAEIEGVRGSAAPQLTSPPVIVASGEPEQHWKIVIARSNQGLCLNVDVGDEQFKSKSHRLGDCGYSDIRGRLPPDVRGDAFAPCIGSTALIPCGSRSKYWVAIRGSVFVPEARQSILVGAAAAKVASVELILANGRRVSAEVVARPLGPDVPLNVYWAELGREQGLKLSRTVEGQVMLCAGNLVEEVVARDSEGNVLGRRVPAWNANPTGDPDGPRPPRLTDVSECV
jgi:hypothetical protein